MSGLGGATPDWRVRPPRRALGCRLCRSANFRRHLRTHSLATTAPHAVPKSLAMPLRAAPTLLLADNTAAPQPHHGTRRRRYETLSSIPLAALRLRILSLPRTTASSDRDPCLFAPRCHSLLVVPTMPCFHPSDAVASRPILPNSLTLLSPQGYPHALCTPAPSPS